jgi:D-alanyl-D-alanine carboxypeptidase
MRSLIDVTRKTSSPADPTGYTQHAISPFPAVMPEGNGWIYAAGELAMTAGHLAKWDASLIERSVLQPESLPDGATATGSQDFCRAIPRTRMTGFPLRC